VASSVGGESGFSLRSSVEAAAQKIRDRERIGDLMEPAREPGGVFYAVKEIITTRQK